MIPFFVYGTLRPGEPNHAAYVRGRARSEEPATLPGAVLYDGPGYPYAVESSFAQGAGIRGELMTPRPSVYGWLLAALDVLEEYTAPGAPGNVYERTAREVRLGDGRAVRAWVYVAAPEVEKGLRERGRVIETGDWRDR
ncbi:gamma-glutamylcyclotransferase family protein [Actinomycetota bacterium Odt1-20B]